MRCQPTVFMEVTTSIPQTLHPSSVRVSEAVDEAREPALPAPVPPRDPT